jgi:hypothetical protein
MSTNNAPIESGLQPERIEWVEETTPGEFPNDPEWDAFSSEITEFSYSTDGNKEGREVLGQIDPAEYDRSTEAASLTVSYRQARFPVDASGTVLDPIAYPIVLEPEEKYVSHTVVARRDVSDGGADGAGFREYAVVKGARPVSASFDGDPSSAEPIPQELGYEAEQARTHIVSQPASSATLVVQSTDDGDTNDVVIESEDATTTETVSLPGSSPNTVETTSDFGDIDAVEVEGEHAGDIQIGISDGTGAIATELLEKPLTGSNVDGVDSVGGVPALGEGSHAAPITETGPLFLGTNATWVGAELADRVHTLDFEVERDVSREPRQTTRKEAIDVGARTVSADADLGGPFSSAERIAEHHRDKTGDLIFEFDNGETITLKNAELVDADDFTRTAGDTNYIPSVTLEPHGDPAVTINKS